MALIVLKDPKDPSKKKKWVPKSIRLQRYLVISIAINICFLLYLFFSSVIK